MYAYDIWSTAAVLYVYFLVLTFTLSHQLSKTCMETYTHPQWLWSATTIHLSPLSSFIHPLQSTWCNLHFWSCKRPAPFQGSCSVSHTLVRKWTSSCVIWHARSAWARAKKGNKFYALSEWQFELSPGNMETTLSVLSDKVGARWKRCHCTMHICWLWRLCWTYQTKTKASKSSKPQLPQHALECTLLVKLIFHLGYFETHPCVKLLDVVGTAP